MPKRPNQPSAPRVYTRADLREIDRRATTEFGIPTLLLMEAAARHVADTVLDGLAGEPHPAALIVCGVGHNAGDGLCAARHLSNAGVHVRILLVLGESLSGDAAIHLAVAQRMGLEFIRPDHADPYLGILRAAALLPGHSAVVDALFGTGLTRRVEGDALRAIRGINAAAANGAAVLAVDVPSGLDVESGEVLGEAVRADITVTFVGPKPGFFTLAAQEYLGDVIVADIGAPRTLTESLGRPLAAVPAVEGRRAAPRRADEPPARRGRRNP
ncbi:MAG: hypothetical protein HBSAPP03_21580 [Phycisphaerae bacterium]|nr:MAG: hypothetical protein HBSAPP03_21580 [Phycisphaerae bacterium]